MSSTKTRQRKLERDRYERKLVRRAQQQRRRRRVQAGIGAFLALAVLGTGTAWLAGWFESAPEEPAAADRCFWQPLEDPQRVDVGTPPNNPPETGTQTATLALDAGAAGSGEVTVELAVDDDPCAAANVTYLAEEGFFDGTVCHELTGEGALRCGDPSGTGVGGPAYQFFGSHFPDPPQDEDGTVVEGEPLDVTYPAGTVALADVAGAHSSQFLIFYEDYEAEGPVWPLLGSVTGGLDLVEAIGVAGTAQDDPPGPPADAVTVESVEVTEPAGGAGVDES